MPVDASHSQYAKFASAWSRARDVLAGEDAIKAAGIRYLPKLVEQSEEEYEAYKERASFFNATARTAEAYLGLIFRRPPFVKSPADLSASALAKTFSSFIEDVDLLGTPLNSYAKSAVEEVISLGRAGTLVDWEGTKERRAYVSLYQAEQILNWKLERVNGRSVPTRIVLHEPTGGPPAETGDPFEAVPTPQIRVLRLVDSSALTGGGSVAASQAINNPACMVEIWRPRPSEEDEERTEWKLISTHVPNRRGHPLPLIPFVFHGARHSLPGVAKLPLGDIIAVNLDHYRLDADYKHGVHFTALPTAWVSGFEKSSSFRIGSSSAWVTDTLGASAGYLEFTGQGLTTFERAMDRDEKLMAVLGSRLLEGQKKVGEAAAAIELRQSGENSILSSLATSVSQSLTQMLQWIYWWHTMEDSPDSIAAAKVLIELNTDFSTTGMDPQELTAVVAAWQAGAISRDTMTDLFRRGEVLPEGRTAEEELRAISIGAPRSVDGGTKANFDAG